MTGGPRADKGGRAGGPRPVTAVITIVHGRHDHLRQQHRSLAGGPPDHWVLVAMDDPAVAQWNPLRPPRPQVVEVAAGARGLRLAAARNAGAQRSAELGADVLVFLDVDCLAGPGMVAAYADAVTAPRPGGGPLVCGPVTYLPPAPAEGYDLSRLSDLDAPHPARPAPAVGEEQAGDQWELFWSLSFALRTEDFARVGGFDEAYAGYGGEDTDFAFAARRAGLRLTWAGAPRAYHQHHAVSAPPVEHRVDIVRNATWFHDKWGEWPMLGWLEALEREGWVTRSPAGWQVLR